eukprot:362754-Chlamydomonas_euryale.AAC.7
MGCILQKTLGIVTSDARSSVLRPDWISHCPFQRAHNSRSICKALKASELTMQSTACSHAVDVCSFSAVAGACVVALGAARRGPAPANLGIGSVAGAHAHTLWLLRWLHLLLRPAGVAALALACAAPVHRFRVVARAVALLVVRRARLAVASSVAAAVAATALARPALALVGALSTPPLLPTVLATGPAVFSSGPLLLLSLPALLGTGASAPVSPACATTRGAASPCALAAAARFGARPRCSACAARAVPPRIMPGHDPPSGRAGRTQGGCPPATCPRATPLPSARRLSDLLSLPSSHRPPPPSVPCFEPPIVPSWLAQPAALAAPPPWSSFSGSLEPSSEPLAARLLEHAISPPLGEF